MSEERGISGIASVVVLGLMILVLLGYVMFGNKNSAGDAARSSGALASAPDQVPADSADADSLDSIDGVVYAGFFGTGVYYRTYTPHVVASTQPGPSANNPVPQNSPKITSKKSTFIRIPGADPATFSEIKSVPLTPKLPNPDSDAGTVTVVTYYHDSDQVFVAQTTTDPSSGDTETSVEPVTADPATFQILNDTYAKDDQHVYVVSWVCEGESCTLVLEIVQGADPATFHTFQDTVMQQSDGTGTVIADASDQSHLFNDGAIVDDVVIPGSNGADLTPILISP